MFYHLSLLHWTNQWFIFAPLSSSSPPSSLLLCLYYFSLIVSHRPHLILWFSRQLAGWQFFPKNGPTDLHPSAAFNLHLTLGLSGHSPSRTMCVPGRVNLAHSSRRSRFSAGPHGHPHPHGFLWSSFEISSSSSSLIGDAVDVSIIRRTRQPNNITEHHFIFEIVVVVFVVSYPFDVWEKLTYPIKLT